MKEKGIAAGERAPARRDFAALSSAEQVRGNFRFNLGWEKVQKAREESKSRRAPDRIGTALRREGKRKKSVTTNYTNFRE